MHHKYVGDENWNVARGEQKRTKEQQPSRFSFFYTLFISKLLLSFLIELLRTKTSQSGSASSFFLSGCQLSVWSWYLLTCSGFGRTQQNKQWCVCVDCQHEASHWLWSEEMAQWESVGLTLCCEIPSATWVSWTETQPGTGLWDEVEDDLKLFQSEPVKMWPQFLNNASKRSKTIR